MTTLDSRLDNRLDKKFSESLAGKFPFSWPGRLILTACLMWGTGSASAQEADKKESPPKSAPAKSGSSTEHGTLKAPQDSGIYTWVDEKGNYHMVDSLTQVPAKHRARAKARAEEGTMADEGGNYSVIAGPASPTAPVTPSVGDPTAPAVATPGAKAAKSGTSSGSAVTASPQDKAYWQARIQAANEAKARAEADLVTIEQEILRLRTMTPAGFQQAIVDQDGRRQGLYDAIQAAEAELNENIPRDARRAGVSPSFLR